MGLTAKFASIHCTATLDTASSAGAASHSATSGLRARAFRARFAGTTTAGDTAPALLAGAHTSNSRGYWQTNPSRCSWSAKFRKNLGAPASKDASAGPSGAASASLLRLPPALGLLLALGLGVRSARLAGYLFSSRDRGVACACLRERRMQPSTRCCWSALVGHRVTSPRTQAQQRTQPFRSKWYSPPLRCRGLPLGQRTPVLSRWLQKRPRARRTRTGRTPSQRSPSRPRLPAWVSARLRQAHRSCGQNPSHRGSWARVAGLRTELPQPARLCRTAGKCRPRRRSPMAD